MIVVPLSSAGLPPVWLLHPCLQERFYFGDGVLPLFESGIPLLLERLKQLPDKDKVTIAYPDEGAWKRFHYQFKGEGYPEVICTKVRDGAKRIVRLKVGQGLKGGSGARGEGRTGGGAAAGRWRLAGAAGGTSRAPRWCWRSTCINGCLGCQGGCMLLCAGWP